MGNKKQNVKSVEDLVFVNMENKNHDVKSVEDLHYVIMNGVKQSEIKSMKDTVCRVL